MSESLFPHHIGPHAFISRLAWGLEQAAFSLLLMVVGCLPWIFSRTQLDTTELPKQTVLVVSAGLVWCLFVVQDALRGAWHLAWDRYSKIIFTSMGVLVLLAIASRDPYGSWVGITKQIPTAVITMLAGAAWWLAIRRLVNAPLRFLLVLGVWFVSAGLFAWGTIAWLVGKTIWPWSLPLFRSMTPLGSVSEVAIFLVPMVVFSFAMLLQGAKLFGETRKNRTRFLRIGAVLLLLPSLTLIGAVESPALWFSLALGVGILVVFLEGRRLRLAALMVAILCLGSAVLALFSPGWNPWRLFGNRISLTVPAEVTLGTGPSWSMAVKGFQEYPLRGRGAGTWVNLFLQERDPALNQSPFANVRFFHGASSVATVVGTTGIFGILVWLTWLFFPAMILLRRGHEPSSSSLARWKPILLALWVSNIALWMSLPFALTQVFFFWLLSALLFVTQTTKIQARTFRFDHPVKGILPLSIAVLAAFLCSWVGMQRFLAERLFVEGKGALEAQSYRASQRNLALAHAWNPWTDIYTSLLSQAYAQEARTRLAKNPTPAELPQIVALLERADRLNAQARLQNPDRIESWQAAAAIASTQNLLVSLPKRTNGDIAGLLQAQSLNPSGTQGALLIANLYLQRVEAEQAWLSSSDEQVKTAARLRFEEATREALQWFDRADELQPNLAATTAGRARLALLSGDTLKAVQALELLQQQGNKSQELQIQIALLYEQAGKRDLATRLLEALVKDHVEDAAPLARWTLMRLYAENNRLDEAIALLESLAKQFPKESMVQQQLAELKRARLEQDQVKLTPASSTSTTSTVPAKKRQPAPKRR